MGFRVFKIQCSVFVFFGNPKVISPSVKTKKCKSRKEASNLGCGHYCSLCLPKEAITPSSQVLKQYQRGHWLNGVFISLFSQPADEKCVVLRGELI